MNILFSRNLAIVLGIITPLLETIRRWHTWQEDPLSFFDDYVLGGLLLYGAWRVGGNARDGQKFLVVGWGVALGMAYCSRFESERLTPAPISTEWVAVVKGIGLALVLIGFVTSLRRVSVEE